MSVADHEIEPVDLVEGWCSIHERYYLHRDGCVHCEDDAANRATKKGE